MDIKEVVHLSISVVVSQGILGGTHDRGSLRDGAHEGRLSGEGPLVVVHPMLMKAFLQTPRSCWTWRTSEPSDLQGLPSGGPGDPNFTFNTTGLET